MEAILTLARGCPTLTFTGIAYDSEKYDAWLLSPDILSDLTGEGVKPGHQDL